MTRKAIQIFINQIYSKRPKENYPTNKTDVHHIDDIWSLDIKDKKVYGPEITRGYRYVLLVINNFSKFVWTIPSKNKNAQRRSDYFESILLI